MGLKLSKIISVLEEAFPKDLALDWDNTGLLVGESNKDINSVLIALDADQTNINMAIECRADLILSHHPIIFNGIKKVSDEEVLGKKILSLIKHNISVYSMHTNFDIGPGGMGESTALRLRAESFKPLEVTGEINGKDIGIGFVYEPKEEISAKALAGLVKEAFNLKKLMVYDAGKMISRIGVCPGSGKGMMEHVTAKGCDAFITGDMTHHDGLDYKDMGVTLIDAGHFGLEKIFIEVMEDFMHRHFPKLTIYRGEDDERIFI